MPACTGELDPVLVQVAACPHWRYAEGSYASPSRFMIGSVHTAASTQSDVTLTICHCVHDGSSQWVSGRNVTSKANIPQLDGNSIELPNPSLGRLQLPFIERNSNLYLATSLFCSKLVISY